MEEDERKDVPKRNLAFFCANRTSGSTFASRKGDPEVLFVQNNGEFRFGTSFRSSTYLVVLKKGLRTQA